MTSRDVLMTLTMMMSVAGPACAVEGQAVPEPRGKLVEHRRDPLPNLAAVDENDRAYSTFRSSADESSERMVVTLENPDTGERGQLHSRTDLESGVTEVNVTGDFGVGTWTDEGLADDVSPPESLVGSYQPWLEFWNQAMADPAHAAHVSGANRDPEIAAQNLICSAVCGVISEASCKLIKHPIGHRACDLIGSHECESQFCTDSTTPVCMVVTNGQCVRETCCQESYGCDTRNVRGCPE